MQPEVVADYGCVTGENPLWHPIEKRLYWVDIPTGRMFRYDPASGGHEQCYEGDPIGGFTIQQDGSFLLFMEKGAIRAWHGIMLGTILDEIPRERGSRFNDVIADPVGRVFCGTLSTSEQLGRLYRMDIDGRLTLQLKDVGTSNGLGFTPDCKGMYYTDSAKREIYYFDYEQWGGTIRRRRLFVRTPEGEGVPDGLTVDADGYVWSARFGGGCVVRYSPEGEEDMRIEFPAKKVTSVTFGGEDYTDIYVTTGGGDNKEEEGSGAGALFRVNLGIKGKPEFFSKIIPLMV